MVDVKRPRMRPPVKREEIVEYFREKIISGELQPGEPLPTREEARLKFKTGSVTVQKTFDILAEQGFITTVPGHLSVVSENLPHKNRIAVVIPGSGDLLKNRFFLSLLHVVEKKQVPSSYEFVPYLVNILRSEEENDDSQRLVDDVASRSLKGVILSTSPTIEDARLRKIQDRCPVILLSKADDGPSCRLIVDHYVSFFEEAVKLARQTGGRRIALFLNSIISDKYMEGIMKLIAGNGLETRNEWIHGFNISESKWAANVARLLFSQDKPGRPDTLFVMDDNLVEAVSASLCEIKDLTPEDLTVIAHANYPEIVPSCFPAYRIGFDVSKILLKGAEMIDRLASNPKVKICESIKAVRLPQNNIPRVDSSASTSNYSIKKNILLKMEEK